MKAQAIKITFGDEDYWSASCAHGLELEETIGMIRRVWEEHEPKEPLIKDEKIRKAVRAWAEANDYGEDEEYQFEDFSTGWKSWSLEHKGNGDDNEIHFNGGIDFERVTHQSYYTIDELCGEEEGPRPVIANGVEFDSYADYLKSREEEE